MESADIHWGLDAQTLGSGGFPVPSVPGTWHRLAVVVPSAGGALGRLIAHEGMNYDTGEASIEVMRGWQSGWMKSSSYPGCSLS